MPLIEPSTMYSSESHAAKTWSGWVKLPIEIVSRTRVPAGRAAQGVGKESEERDEGEREERGEGERGRGVRARGGRKGGGVSVALDCKARYACDAPDAEPEPYWIEKADCDVAEVDEVDGS